MEVAKYIARHKNSGLHTDKKDGYIAMVEMAATVVVYLGVFVFTLFVALTFCTTVIERLGYQGVILPLLLALAYHPVEVVASTIDDIANVRGSCRELKKKDFEAIVIQTIVRHVISGLIIIAILAGLVFGATLPSQRASQVVSPEVQVSIIGIIVLMLVAEKALLKYFLH